MEPHVGALAQEALQHTYRSHRVMNVFRDGKVSLPLPLRHGFSNLIPYRLDRCPFLVLIQGFSLVQPTKRRASDHFDEVFHDFHAARIGSRIFPFVPSPRQLSLIDSSKASWWPTLPTPPSSPCTAVYCSQQVLHERASRRSPTCPRRAHPLMRLLFARLGLDPSSFFSPS